MGAMVGSVADRFSLRGSRTASRVHCHQFARRSPDLHRAERVRSLAGIIEIDGADSRPVAVLANHDGPLVVSILAAVAAGKIVVVMDPIVAADDHDHVMAESGASMVPVDESKLNSPAQLRNATRSLRIC
ncbi:MAG: hypothetical protein R2735_08800 [Microthrixaceae bacterium]